MDFYLQNGYKIYFLTCEKVYEGESVERYKVFSKKNPSHYIILQNNRPLLRKKLLLQTKRLTWKVTEGEITNISAVNEVIKIIEDWIQPALPRII